MSGKLNAVMHGCRFLAKMTIACSDVCKVRLRKLKLFLACGHFSMLTDRCVKAFMISNFLFSRSNAIPGVGPKKYHLSYICGYEIFDPMGSGNIYLSIVHWRRGRTRRLRCARFLGRQLWIVFVHSTALIDTTSFASLRERNSCRAEHTSKPCRTKLDRQVGRTKAISNQGHVMFTLMIAVGVCS